MILRNKKTGELWELIYRYPNELNEEWEGYKPTEPLIKDEKVRKAVRAWAEAESIPLDGTVSYNYDEYSLGWYHTSLEFSKHIQNLRDESEYTIAELCGEEEE